MTTYWDNWDFLISQIEQNKKVSASKVLKSFHLLFSELHEFDHKSKDGHILSEYLKKNTYLETLLNEVIKTE